MNPRITTSIQMIKRYLAFALTFLMPIYPNFELLAAQNKEKIEAIENILNKGQAKKEIKKAIPSLADLAEGIGDPAVRNRGTIGGSIANNDPAADYPSACIALNATIHTNSRKIEASKFFSGMFETALKKGELIEAVEFQIPNKSSYQKHPNPASRYAVVGVYVAKNKNDVNVAVTGAKSCVYKDENLSKALSKNFSVSAVDGVKVSSSGMNTDIHASAEYRASLVATYAKKAIEAC